MTIHNFVTDVVGAFLVLGTLVLVHEWGHYAAAKFFGVRVETFSLGFGKRLFGWKRGDTDYRVSALPFGGYVKMSGENPMEESTGDPAEFMSHPRWQRLIIAVAGPAMNILLSIVALTGIFMVHYEHQFFLDQPAVIGWVEPKSPAAKADIQPGDRIVRIDGVENPTWEKVHNEILLSTGQPFHFAVQRGSETLQKQLAFDNSNVEPMEYLGLVPDQPNAITRVEPGAPAALAGIQVGDELASIGGVPVHSMQGVIEYLQESKAKPVEVTVRRNGTALTFTVVPKMLDPGDGKPRYRIGVGSDPIHVDRLPLSAAFMKSLETNKKFSLLIAEMLQKLVRRKVSIKQFSGPVGISALSGEALRLGPLQVLSIMAAISLNLGIFNLLPIPILDGGLILLLLIEGLIRRDIKREIKERVYQAAFVFLILFAAIVIYNDISKTALGKFLP